MGTVAVVRTQRTWLLVTSFVAGLAGLASLVVTGGAGILALPWVAIFLAFQIAWSRAWREQRGTVTADARGLVLDGTLLVPREAIRHGHVQRRNGRAYLRLRRAARLSEIEVADEEEGQALLRAMRLDPAQSVGQFLMAQGTYRSLFKRSAVVGGLSLLFAIPAAIAAARLQGFPVVSFVLIASWLIAYSLWSLNNFVRIAVGADGIRFRRLIYGSRFVTYRAIEHAEGSAQDVTLQLRDGSKIDLHNAPDRKWLNADFGDWRGMAAAFIERVNALAREHRRGSPQIDGLARGGRDTRQWVREVTHSSEEHATFRVAAVPADVLWRVVEDPAAESTTRAGAALALRARLDDDGRARLRVLADACAAPPLGRALRVAASPTDEELEEALDPLFDDEHAPREHRARHR